VIIRVIRCSGLYFDLPGWIHDKKEKDDHFSAIALAKS
jgi:hypothetical protein